MQKLPINRQIQALEWEKQVYGVPLRNQAGQIHPTAKAIATLAGNDHLTQRLGTILTALSKQRYASGCIPIYRDAIVFYNEANEIVSVLNICLQCDFLLAENGETLKVDSTVFPKIKDFLG